MPWHTTSLADLLDCGADPDARGPCTQTALHIAAAFNCAHCVGSLLGVGADMEIPGIQNFTALQVAAWNGHETVTGMLLEAGAEVDARGDDDVTALLAATVQGHFCTVEQLLEYKADIGLRYPGSDKTALQAAFNNGHRDILKLLLDHRAGIVLQQQDDLEDFTETWHLTVLAGMQDYTNYLVDYIEGEGMFAEYIQEVQRLAESRGYEELLEWLSDRFGPLPTETATSDAESSSSAGS